MKEEKTRKGDSKRDVTIEKETEYDLETKKTRHKTRLNIREVEIKN
jgi:hypothetical protein